MEMQPLRTDIRPSPEQEDERSPGGNISVLANNDALINPFNEPEEPEGIRRILMNELKTLCLFLILISVVATLAGIIYIYLKNRTLQPAATVSLTGQFTPAISFDAAATMDETANPCDDFYRFVCGKLQPKDFMVTSSHFASDHFTRTFNVQQQRILKLIEDIKSDDSGFLRQMKRYYSACRASEQVAVKNSDESLEPLMDLLQALIPGNQSLDKTLGIMHRTIGKDYLFDVSVEGTDNDTLIVTVDPPAGGKQHKSSEDLEGKVYKLYRNLIINSISYLNRTLDRKIALVQEIFDRVDKVVQYELYFAQARTDAGSESESQSQLEISLEELNVRFGRAETSAGNEPRQLDRNVTGIPKQPQLNWTEYIANVLDAWPGIRNSSVTVTARKLGYLEKIANLVQISDRRDIEIYLAWKLIYTFGTDTSKEFGAFFEEFETETEVRTTFPAREQKVSCDETWTKHRFLAFALIHKYILVHKIDDGLIKSANETATHILAKFRTTLKNFEWMDEETKTKGFAKLDKLRFFIAYPEWLLNVSALEEYYDGLEFVDSHFVNKLKILEWYFRNDVFQSFFNARASWPAGSTNDHSSLGTVPYYILSWNAIALPPGYFQQPFMGNGLRALDYGTLGVFIGHEIMHGFGVRGNEHDEDGQINYWWTEQTLARFTENAKCFEDQYNRYKLPEYGPNLTINGTITLDENIADSVGIQVAWEAFREPEIGESPERPVPSMQKYTPEQTFFIGFAHVSQSPVITATVFFEVELLALEPCGCS